jgi:hypothetical protein
MMSLHLPYSIVQIEGVNMSCFNEIPLPKYVAAQRKDIRESQTISALRAAINAAQGSTAVFDRNYEQLLARVNEHRCLHGGAGPEAEESLAWRDVSELRVAIQKSGSH